MTGIPTPLPTSSPTFYATQTTPVTGWILFGVFLFLVLSSSYIARLLVAVVHGLSRFSPQLVDTTIAELQNPLTHGLRVLFLYIAFYYISMFVLLDMNAMKLTNLGTFKGAYISWAWDIVYYIIRLYVERV